MEKELGKIGISKIINMILVFAVSILFIFPLYWIITGALKDNLAIIARVPEWFPKNPTMANFERLFNQPAGAWMMNTVLMAALSTLLTCVAASMAGYALAKKRFPGRNIIFTLMVCAMALPKQVTVIPLLKQMNFFGLHDNIWAIILPTVAWPFGVFLMKQFSEGVSDEIIEAAKVDGASEAKTFIDVIVPMVRPGIGALAIFTFVTAWNDYFLQLIMLVSRENLTISLGIATLQAESSTDFGLIMAGACLAAIPIITVFIAFQKYFTQGIAMGAVKG